MKTTPGVIIPLTTVKSDYPMFQLALFLFGSSDSRRQPAGISHEASSHWGAKLNSIAGSDRS